METKNRLKYLFTEHWNYMAISAACKLNLFDNLQVAKTAEQLAMELSLNKEKLLLLLNALHNSSFLDKSADFFKVNSLSEFLTENNPDSLKYACLNWSLEHLNAWQHLDFSITTGKSSFEKIYGLTFFDYLDKYPERLFDYHKAMYQYAIDDYKDLPNVIDFSDFKSLMDVGGGFGAAINLIQERYPSIECTLFDLEKVTQQVQAVNFKKNGGNFFEEIPMVAEAIILSRVLHDWNDEKANIILMNCYNSLPTIGTLYVIENCIDRIESNLSLLSLNMTVMCQSFERTSSEYIDLCVNNGFQFESDKKLNELQTILIFKK